MIKMLLVNVTLLVITIVIITKEAFCDQIFKYPAARQDPNTGRTYNGVLVKDPYEWLEDINRKETKQFVKLQNDTFANYIKDVPSRETINSVATQLWTLPTNGILVQAATNLFVSYRNTGSQPQNVMYSQNTIDSEPTLFFDPNSLSPDGSKSLGNSWFTLDGVIWAYQICSPDDWCDIHIKNLKTGQKYSEVLTNTHGTDPLVVLLDNQTLLYVGYTDKEGKQGTQGRIFHHTIGTPQTQDFVVVEFPKTPDDSVKFKMSPDFLYLIIYTSSPSASGNSVYIGDLTKSNGQITAQIDPIITLVKEQDSTFTYVANKQTLFYFFTNQNAPNGKVVTVDLAKPNNWQTLIEENETDILEMVTAVNKDQLVAQYRRYGRSILQLRCLKTGKLIYTLFEGLGTIMDFSGDIYFKDIFYQVATFFEPGTNYHVDLSQPLVPPVPYFEATIPNFDRTQFVANQVSYASADGTEIQMYIVHGKNLKMDGKNPCQLISFQGSGDQFKVKFSVRRMMVFRNMKAVYAVPLCRGGSELGQKWLEAGMKLNKENAINDFIGAAELLLNKRYTSPDLLIIAGSDENGGVVAVASANRKPEYFGCLISEHSLLDLLNYQLFKNGETFLNEYGVATNADDFSVLRRYTPYQNMLEQANPKARYPATLLVTSNQEDTSVFAAHAYKFTAAVQTNYGNHPFQTNPLLLWVNPNIKEVSDEGVPEFVTFLCFMVKTLKITFDP